MVNPRAAGSCEMQPWCCVVVPRERSRASTVNRVLHSEVCINCSLNIPVASPHTSLPQQTPVSFLPKTTSRNHQRHLVYVLFSCRVKKRIIVSPGILITCSWTTTTVSSICCRSLESCRCQTPMSSEPARIASAEIHPLGLNVPIVDMSTWGDGRQKLVLNWDGFWNLVLITEKYWNIDDALLWIRWNMM